MTDAPGAEGRAIRRLCRDLGLPPPGPFSQDWAYELAPEFRTVEALSRYLQSYENPEYGDVERRVLADITLDTINGMLVEYPLEGKAAWRRLAALLRARPELHREQIDYWSSLGSTLEDAFYLAPFARELRAELFPGASDPSEEP